MTSKIKISPTRAAFMLGVRLSDLTAERLMEAYRWEIRRAHPDHSPVAGRSIQDLQEARDVLREYLKIRRVK